MLGAHSPAASQPPSGGDDSPPLGGDDRLCGSPPSGGDDKYHGDDMLCPSRTPPTSGSFHAYVSFSDVLKRASDFPAEVPLRHRALARVAQDLAFEASGIWPVILRYRASGSCLWLNG